MKSYIYTTGVLLLSLILISGCSDNYRYPCQDPKQWEMEHCNKPQCEVHRECPSHIFGELETDQ
jgi:hypothetical protein